MKSVAVILDGGFVLKKLSTILQRDISGEDVYNFATNCLKTDSEELFRIFFYHCAPYEEKKFNPIIGQYIDFKNTVTAKKNNQLLLDLAQRNHVAVRKGHLVFRGWTIKEATLSRIQRQIAQSQVSATSQTSFQPLKNIINNFHYLDPHAANAAPADDENGRMRYNIPAAGGGRSLFLGAASPTLRRTPTTRCTTDCRSFGKHAG